MTALAVIAGGVIYVVAAAAISVVCERVFKWNAEGGELVAWLWPLSIPFLIVVTPLVALIAVMYTGTRSWLEASIDRKGS